LHESLDVEARASAFIRVGYMYRSTHAPDSVSTRMTKPFMLVNEGGGMSSARRGQSSTDDMVKVARLAEDLTEARSSTRQWQAMLHENHAAMSKQNREVAEITTKILGGINEFIGSVKSFAETAAVSPATVEAQIERDERAREFEREQTADRTMGLLAGLGQLVPVAQQIFSTRTHEDLAGLAETCPAACLGYLRRDQAAVLAACDAGEPVPAWLRSWAGPKSKSEEL
jgi:hypothetical protein